MLSNQSTYRVHYKSSILYSTTKLMKHSKVFMSKLLFCGPIRFVFHHIIIIAGWLYFSILRCIHSFIVRWIIGETFISTKVFSSWLSFSSYFFGCLSTICKWTNIWPMDREIEAICYHLFICVHLCYSDESFIIHFYCRNFLWKVTPNTNQHLFHSGQLIYFAYWCKAVNYGDSKQLPVW